MVVSHSRLSRKFGSGWLHIVHALSYCGFPSMSPTPEDDLGLVGTQEIAVATPHQMSTRRVSQLAVSHSQFRGCVSISC